MAQTATIPAHDTLVTGLNLQAGTLSEQIGDRPTLIVFLRHFG